MQDKVCFFQNYFMCIVSLAPKIVFNMSHTTDNGHDEHKGNISFHT